MEDRGEFLSIEEAARELSLGQSTVWLLLKRSDVDRFRIPGEGKKTFIRRQDLPRLKAPVLVSGGSAAAKIAA